MEAWGLGFSQLQWISNEIGVAIPGKALKYQKDFFAEYIFTV